MGKFVGGLLLGLAICFAIFVAFYAAVTPGEFHRWIPRTIGWQFICWAIIIVTGRANILSGIVLFVIYYQLCWAIPPANLDILIFQRFASGFFIVSLAVLLVRAVLYYYLSWSWRSGALVGVSAVLLFFSTL
jgi:hypothetical protein